ncbi:MAG: HAD family phosphatase [Comamonadaceae bacterium]|jgi:putative hydrolase of the HAD superfamily|nr:HAD family phosphatase [Comamonadaceae bacterium]
MKIVFDFGGVVFRWQPASLLARVWPHRVGTLEQGARLAAQFFQNYGGDWGQFDQGLIGADEVAQRISARMGWPLDEVEAVVRAVPDELTALPATVALIRELRAAGHSLHFLSNMPEPYADHLSATYPLTEWFESGLFSGRVKQSKPGAEIYALAERHFDARPSELLFIDDHPVNVEAALARDWQSFLFTDAADARRELLSRRLLP